MSLNLERLKQINEFDKVLIFGYIRCIQSIFINENNTHYNIPPLVSCIIILYFHIPRECPLWGRLSPTSTSMPYGIFKLDRDCILIGRDKNRCDIQLQEAEICDVHAKIQLNLNYNTNDTNSHDATICDLSTNGIFINQRKIDKNKSYPLFDGDEIQLIKGKTISFLFFKNVAFSHNIRNCSFHTDKIVVVPWIRVVHPDGNGNDFYGKMSRGCIIGLPSKSINNKLEIIEMFKNVRDECIENDLSISNGYFLYIGNWKMLQKYDENVNENTIFYFIRFFSRDFNAMFKGLSGDSFNIHLFCKTPKKNGKDRDYEYRAYQQPNTSQNAEHCKISKILDINGNKTDFNDPFAIYIDCNSNQHPLNNKIINENFDINIDSLFNLKPNDYQKQRRFMDEEKKEDLKDNVNNGDIYRHENIQHNEYNKEHFVQNENNNIKMNDDYDRNWDKILNHNDEQNKLIGEMRDKMDALIKENKMLKAQLKIYQNR